MRMRCELAAFVTLPGAETAWDVNDCQAEDTTLDNARRLDKFLMEVEKRAFRIAVVHLRDPDDALDVVQDAMLKLAQKYSDKPSEQWPPLFYRILQNGVRDLQRRRSVRKRLMAWLPRFDAEGDAPPDPMELVADTAPDAPSQLMQDEAMQRLELLLRELPTRQREAFTLRNFEGLDVEATAQAMGCTAGSVKTHYSRAVHFLREQLGTVW
jgi:RNA polymerase sigma-70 factor, ECF subfamily